MIPDLMQTRLLKRFITMEPRSIPECGPLAAVSIAGNWLEIVEETDREVMARITLLGRAAFWRGVRQHGRCAVMGKVCALRKDGGAG